MATGSQRLRFPHAGAALDVARRHRLERAEAEPAAGSCGVSDREYSRALSLLTASALCHSSLMNDALALPDLDALDHAALKAMVLPQYTEFRSTVWRGKFSAAGTYVFAYLYLAHHAMQTPSYSLPDIC